MPHTVHLEERGATHELRHHRFEAPRGHSLGELVRACLTNVHLHSDGLKLSLHDQRESLGVGWHQALEREASCAGHGLQETSRRLRVVGEARQIGPERPVMRCDRPRRDLRATLKRVPDHGFTIDGHVQRTPNRCLAKHGRPGVEDERGLVVARVLKDRHLSRVLQRLERVRTDLVEHVQPISKQIRPRRANARVAIQNHPFDARRPQVIRLVRADLVCGDGSRVDERAGTNRLIRRLSNRLELERFEDEWRRPSQRDGDRLVGPRLNVGDVLVGRAHGLRQ